MIQLSSSTKQNFETHLNSLEVHLAEAKADINKNEAFETIPSAAPVVSYKGLTECRREPAIESIDLKQEQYLRNRSPIPIPDNTITIPTATQKSRLRLTNSNSCSNQPSNSLTLYNFGRRQYSQFPINLLQDKALKNVFKFLNHSDLVQCRSVQRHWKNLISEDPKFLQKTVYVVNIVKSYNVATSSLVYNDLTIFAQLPFLHGRFQYIDYNFLKDPQRFKLKNSDNEKYVPEGKFLKTLSSLEFRHCVLCWHTLKKLLIRASILETLIISNCYILDEVNSPNTTQQATEFEEFNAGNAIFGLKQLEIYENRCLSNVTSILKKFIGYGNQALSSIKITYYPPAERASNSSTDDRDHDPKKSESHASRQSVDFCRELKALISNCANSLQVLSLDIQDQPTLNLIGYHVVKHLEALGPRLDLTEFRLTPSLGCWVHKPESMPNTNVAMTMRNMNTGTQTPQQCLTVAATAMARFLESQKHLKILALPCIEHPDAFSSCFHTVLLRLPAATSIEYLAVPSAGFLPVDLLNVFPKLKALKVGGACCQDFTSGWEIFQNYTKEQLVQLSGNGGEDGAIVQSEFVLIKAQQPQQLAITPKDHDFYERLEMMKRMEDLCLTTNIIPDNFKIVMKSLANLTTLDISSGSETPVIRDDDIQACINYLKKLQNLLIGCSDELSDYGITGIPNEHCNAMFKNQRYQKSGVYKNIWASEKVTGRPLSDLKGLRKLVLKGKSNFTDIGIAYGLVFQELKYCHLPYSDYITSWGIARFGSMNPSLEAFGLSGVSELTKEEFLSLRRTHPRLRKGDASRTGYFSENVSGIDNFALMLVTPETVKAFLIYVVEQIQKAYALLTPPDVEIHRS
ncbi:unnamed protein product [Orchesella dallaii]|uniref:F-box domain-containing protein n=1 Tax=Orchesella dallaii TaxID=48710 RepID=A0ABP1Q863_9HEXA